MGEEGRAEDSGLQRWPQTDCHKEFREAENSKHELGDGPLGHVDITQLHGVGCLDIGAGGEVRSGARQQDHENVTVGRGLVQRRHRVKIQLLEATIGSVALRRSGDKQAHSPLC